MSVPKWGKIERGYNVRPVSYDELTVESVIKLARLISIESPVIVITDRGWIYKDYDGKDVATFTVLEGVPRDYVEIHYGLEHYAL